MVHLHRADAGIGLEEIVFNEIVLRVPNAIVHDSALLRLELKLRHALECSPLNTIRIKFHAK